MGSRYPRKAIKLTNTALLLALLPLSALSSPPVAPQTLDYAVRSAGLPFSINATRTLSKGADGLWKIQVKANNILGEISETSLFRWHGCVPRTEQYNYLRKGLGQKREARVSFDRDTRIASSTRSKRAPREYAFADDTTDELALSLWLQCELSKGEQTITVEVGDDRKVEQQHYNVVSKETLSIDGKSIDTVKVQRLREPDSARQTYMWFAPELDYALVQLIQDEDGSEHSMSLRSIK